MKERNKFARKLCGKVVEWKNNIWLRSWDLLPKFRVLHLLCCANFYPRFGNRGDLSSLMVTLLYSIANVAKFCLPTLMRSTIIKYSNSSKSSHPRFYYLMSRLAQHFGVKPPKSDVPYGVRILDTTAIRKCLGDELFKSIFGPTASTLGGPSSSFVLAFEEEKEPMLDSGSRWFVEEHLEALA